MHRLPSVPRFHVVAALAVGAVLAGCAQVPVGLSGAAVPPGATAAAADPAPPEPSGPVDTTGATSGVDAVDVGPLVTATAASAAVNPWQALLDAPSLPPEPAAAAGASAAVGDGGAAPAAAAAGGGLLQRSLLPTTGSPEACRTALKPIADALVAHRSVDVRLTTIKADGSFVSWSWGTVTRQTLPSAAGQPSRAVLDAALEQTFSDRTYARPLSSTGTCRAPCTTTQAFDVNRPDRLRLQVDPATGATTLVLLSWGGAAIQLSATCEGNLMWGYAGDTFYLVNWIR